MSPTINKHLPVVRCREETWDDGTKRWVFWCPFCRCEHVHSAGPGHRTAHCGSHHEVNGHLVRHESPFKATSYVLELEPVRKQSR